MTVSFDLLPIIYGASLLAIVAGIGIVIWAHGVFGR